MRTYYIVIFMCLLTLSGCHKSRFIVKKVPLIASPETMVLSSTEPPPITVIIHGTKLFIGSFYRTYFNGKDGLKHASELPAHKFSYKLLKKLSACDSRMFPYEYMYYFGWSGLLSVKARDNAAEVLYDSLVEFSQTYYERHKVQPVIRLICHSHGASIGLSLARVHAQKRAQLSIHSLIMLACPVQWSISAFSHSPLFKNIYSFYACLDCVQIMAPEISQYIYDEPGQLIEKKRRGYLFSAQTFKGAVPIKQARIKMYHHTITHSDFMSDKFLCTLPQLLRAVDDIYDLYGNDIKYKSKEVVCSIV